MRLPLIHRDSFQPSAVPIFALVLASASLIFAPAAAAETSASYPGAGAFTSTVEGWTPTIEQSASCAPAELGVTCQEVHAEWVSSGGTGIGSSSSAADGFLRVRAGATTGTAKAQQNSVTWVSPPFEYKGADGLIPDLLDTPTSVRATPAPFGTYRVRYRMVDLSGGPTLTILFGGIESEGSQAATSWTALGSSPSTTVAPWEPILGHEYQLQARVTFTVGEAIGPAAEESFDLDDLVLRAVNYGDTTPEEKGPTKGETGASGSPGAPGEKGPAGSSGAAGAGESQPAAPNKHLYIRLSCPRRYTSACQTTFWGTTKKHGKAITKRSGANIWSGGWRWVRVNPKNAYRAKIERFATKKKKTMAVRLRIASAGGKKVVWHRYRVFERLPEGVEASESRGT